MSCVLVAYLVIVVILCNNCCISRVFPKFNGSHCPLSSLTYPHTALSGQRYLLLFKSKWQASFSPAIYNSPRPRAIQMHSVITDILCNHCNTSITAFNPHPAIRRHKNISLAKLFSYMDTLSCTEASMFLSKSTPPFLFSLALTYTPKLIVVLAHESTSRRDGSICWHR